MDTRDTVAHRYSGQKTNSRSLTRPEYIRAEARTRHLVVGDMLDSRPVLGLEQDFGLEPVGDRLLPEARTVQELSDSSRERGLASGDLNGLPQRSDMGLFHKAADYKHTCNPVNKPAGVTTYKGACILDFMAARQRNEALTQQKRLRQSPFVRGQDGRTANERLREAIAAKGPDYEEADLVRDCNRLISRQPGDPEVSQQVINNLRNDHNDAARSSFLSVIAEALGVRAVWLQFGAGPMRDDRAALLDELLDQVAKKRAKTP